MSRISHSSFPEYDGIAHSRITLLAYGLDRQHILDTLSETITSVGGGTLGVRRDIGSKLGDYFVIAFLVSGPPYAVIELQASLERLCGSAEKLAGVRVHVLPQIDYRESIEASHRQDISIKCYIKDRGGIQTDLMQIFDNLGLRGIDHFGRVVVEGQALVYHGSYTFGLPRVAMSIVEEGEHLARVSEACDEIKRRVLQKFGHELKFLAVNGSVVCDKRQ
jgi:glycine cleavage system regulatory protein